jgi:predicted RNA polymerase sigma factor
VPTEWPQIVALYDVLLRLADTPVVALNHAVAVSMIQGPEAGLELLSRLESDPRINADRRFHAVRAHLLEMTGNIAGARDDYETAARQATNLQQQRYLHRQIARLDTRV